MPEFVVASVAPDTRTYEANGPKIAYKVRFVSLEDREVEWSQNASTPPPHAGQEVEGVIDWNGKYGAKFKRAFQQQNGQQAGSVQKFSGASTWKPRDPADTAAIQRQHSQEMALRYAGIHPGAGRKMIDLTGMQALEDVIKPLIDWFQRDVEAGVKLAEKDQATKANYGQAKDTTERTGVSDVPVPAPQEFQQPEPATQGALDDIPF